MTAAAAVFRRGGYCWHAFHWCRLDVEAAAEMVKLSRVCNGWRKLVQVRLLLRWRLLCVTELRRFALAVCDGVANRCRFVSGCCVLTVMQVLCFPASGGGANWWRCWCSCDWRRCCRGWMRLPWLERCRCVELRWRCASGPRWLLLRRTWRSAWRRWFARMVVRGGRRNGARWWRERWRHCCSCDGDGMVARWLHRTAGTEAQKRGEDGRDLMEEDGGAAAAADWWWLARRWRRRLPWWWKEMEARVWEVEGDDVATCYWLNFELLDHDTCLYLVG